jgi:hypothetical protein
VNCLGNNGVAVCIGGVHQHSVGHAEHHDAGQADAEQGHRPVGTQIATHNWHQISMVVLGLVLSFKGTEGALYGAIDPVYFMAGKINA